jgi:endonuclease G, mitochondrial
MDIRQQQHKASERYRETGEQRADIQRRQEASSTSVVDSPEQIEARARRLLSNGEIAVETLRAALPEGKPVTGTAMLERLIGRSSELQSVNFLTRGERVARTVARISLQQGGRIVGFGTGFLVGPRLIMTNNHVLAHSAGRTTEGDRYGATRCSISSRTSCTTGRTLYPATPAPRFSTTSGR